MTILEFIEVMQGGTLTRNEAGRSPAIPPLLWGRPTSPKKFVLEAYSSQIDQGGNVIKYEKVRYPGCTGQPVGINSEDGVFRLHEYVINSAPGKGEAPYELSYVDELPDVDAVTPAPGK